MDHLDISNTVDSTGAFSVEGAATTDMSACWVFWIWYVKRPLRKLATKIFDLSFHNLGVRFHVHLSSQRARNIFFYIRGKSVFSAVQLTPPVFLVSTFQGTELRKQKMTELPSMNHHRVPWLGRWTIHGDVHSVTGCHYCKKFSICYLNGNISKPLFTSYSVIMCN